MDAKRFLLFDFRDTKHEELFILLIDQYLQGK